nr:MAG TPA: hypothetical protein [Caudoviricetes sp.]
MKRKNKIIKDAGNVEAGVKFFNNATSMSEDILIPEYDKEGTAILPASWRENDFYDTLTLEDILNNDIEEDVNNTSCKYSVESAEKLGIPLNDIEKRVLTKYGRAFEELAK